MTIFGGCASKVLFHDPICSIWKGSSRSVTTAPPLFVNAISLEKVFSAFSDTMLMSHFVYNRCLQGQCSTDADCSMCDT